MRIFSWDISAIRVAPREPSADPTQRTYMDATILLVRAFTGRTWSRRRSPLSDRRWRAAYALLTAAEVVRGGDRIDCTYIEAIGLLWVYNANQTQLRNAGRFVSPRNPAAPKTPFVR